MITGFDKETNPLTDYELYTIMPMVVRGLSVKYGKLNAVTNGYIVLKLKSLGYKIEAPRLRKIINHIRTNDIIPGLIATSDGYYVAQTAQELLDYEESLKGREDAIREVRLSIARQRRAVYEETRQQALLFNQ